MSPVQLPLWGEPERPRAKPDGPELAITKYAGKPTTCHLCILDVARGQVRHERDLASHDVKTQHRSWLACHAHTREIRSSPALLQKYLR